MKKFLNRLTVLMVLGVFSAFSYSQVTTAQTRGSLLYTTHCIYCHTTQMHWRNDKLAFDWDSLKVQVRRWQGNALLQWSEADITEVSRYLNDTIYRYPTLADRVGLVSTSTSTSIQPTQ
jgi:mono/diheme cytochrome c family protein